MKDDMAMARGATSVQRVADSTPKGRSEADGQQKRICMHVQSPAITDPRVMREASALAEANYHVTIVDIEHQRRPTSETVDGVHLKHVFVSPKSVRHYDPVQAIPWLLFKVTRTLRSALKVIGTRADAYHAHDITALPTCYLAARLRRKRLIFDAHELPLTQQHILEKAGLAGVSRALLRLMMRRCDGSIAVSPPLIDEMQKLYGGPRATLVRNCPDYQPPVQSDLLRERLGLGAQTRVALYQGGLQANRALDVLVRAAPYLAPGHVIVVMGKGEQEAALRALIAELQVAERVVLTPAVPYAELLRVTASADLGLIVYRPTYSLNVRYCLPNKLFEYLMAGVPVLASPLDAVAEILTTYDAGRVVASLEPQAVAEAISALLADEGARRRMRENGWRAAREEFRWELEQRTLVALYQRMFSQAALSTDAAPVRSM
jgi:glycosyltransferase involved in cell wall biosynthesis